MGVLAEEENKRTVEPFTVDFDKLTSVERADSELSTLISANLKEVSNSLRNVNKYSYDKSKNQEPENTPELRSELEPVRYLALDPRVATGEGLWAHVISSTITGFSKNTELTDYLAERLEPLLTAEDYDPSAVDKEIRERLIPNVTAVVTKALPNSVGLIDLATRDPITKNHDMANDFSSIISMTIITAVNEKNAALGRGKDEDEFPLKNYFPQYFGTEPKIIKPSLTTAQNSSNTPSPSPLSIEVPEEAAMLARQAFDSSNAGQSAQLRQQDSQVSANVDSRKKATALE